MTIVMVTHDNDIAAHADRIVEMRDGAILHESLGSTSAIPAG
jgi:ABC-type lipoprotein export system ATPase subunit